MHRVDGTANPGFLLLLAGNSVSAFGNSLFLVGLMLYFSAEIVSPLWLGITQAAAFVPMLLFGYAGGAAADRWSRSLLMAGADMVRGAALLGAGVLLPRIAVAGTAASAPLLVALVFLMGSMQALFQPATVSLVAAMEVPGGRRDLIALRTASSHLASLAGQGLGGLLLLAAGFPVLILLNGAGFLFSGLSELLIRDPRRVPAAGGGTPAGEREVSLRGVVAELADLNRLGAALDLFLLQQFLFPFCTVALPFYLQYRLELPGAWVGYCLAAALAGSIVAALLRGRRGAARNPRGVYTAGVVAGTLLLLALLPAPGRGASLALPGSLLFGGAVGIVHLHSVGFLQRRGRAWSGGRRHGVIEAAASGLTPAAYLIGGIVVAGLPYDSPLLFGVAGTVLAGFSLLRLAPAVVRPGA